MKSLYNWLRQPAQKFFRFAAEDAHHMMWLVPLMVFDIAVKTRTVPPREYVIAFAMYMSLFYVVSWACRYFVRELDHPA